MFGNYCSQGENLMKLLLVILALISPLAFGQDLCANYKPERHERYRESMFTKESALVATQYLESYVQARDGGDPWHAFTVIQGYMLRRDALAATASGSNSWELEQYCEFVTRQGVHRE